MDNPNVATAPINYLKDGTDMYQALGGIMEVITKRGIDRMMYHLVMLRASQINGCGYCVEMHTREAREDGETNARLDQLIVWQHSSEYSEAERAAFAWTEALTTLDDPHAYEPLRAELRKHFSDSEIATLTGLVGMINLWNRFQVANH